MSEKYETNSKSAQVPALVAAYIDFTHLTHNYSLSHLPLLASSPDPVYNFYVEEL